MIVDYNRVYRRTESSPLFEVATPELARDLAERLNRDDQAFAEVFGEE